VIVPFTFSPELVPHPKIPSSKWPVSLSMVYSKAETDKSAILGLKWALETAHAIDVNVQCNITEDDILWENFQSLLAAAADKIPKVAPIILCTFS
jgi:hypothetical protein